MPDLGEFTEECVLRKAREGYPRGEARVSLRVGSVALLVIDRLGKFVQPRWSPFWVPEATRQAPLIRRLEDACRAMAVPVVHIGYQTTLRGLDTPAPMRAVPIGAGVAPFLDRLFVRPAFYEPVAPLEGELVVLKHTYSAFHGTPLGTGSCATSESTR
jgi:nicotinamidase-related amidase